MTAPSPAAPSPAAASRYAAPRLGRAPARPRHRCRPHIPAADRAALMIAERALARFLVEQERPVMVAAIMLLASPRRDPAVLCQEDRRLRPRSADHRLDDHFVGHRLVERGRHVGPVVEADSGDRIGRIFANMRGDRHPPLAGQCGGRLVDRRGEPGRCLAVVLVLCRPAARRQRQRARQEDRPPFAHSVPPCRCRVNAPARLWLPPSLRMARTPYLR